MMYSTTVQKINTKDLVFWAVLNSQNCGCEVVNTYFETSNNFQSISFSCSLEYNLFHAEILHVEIMYHWLHLELFSGFF